MAHWDLCHNAMQVLMHVGYSVVDIVAAIDCINWCSWHWVSQIGDMDVLQEDSGCQGITLVKAVAKAMAARESPSKGLSGSLEELAGMITAVVDIGLIEKPFQHTCLKHLQDCVVNGD
jgi:hypothetical protein